MYIKSQSACRCPHVFSKASCSPQLPAVRPHLPPSRRYWLPFSSFDIASSFRALMVLVRPPLTHPWSHHWCTWSPSQHVVDPMCSLRQAALLNCRLWGPTCRPHGVTDFRSPALTSPPHSGPSWCLSALHLHTHWATIDVHQVPVSM